MYWTYFVVEWDKTPQVPSDQKCVQCGGRMNSVGPMPDDNGMKFEGLVCHSCKRVIWVKVA
jgi:hypothetical protein